MERRSDLAALRHPLFALALALLVLNDHVLKGAGILPGWLTGKLSDFAGLIVAPVLLSAMLRARDARRRALAFLIVGGWFTAVKLVPAAASASIAAASMLGLDWTIVVDPTDLVALSVLPLAWHVAAERGAPSVGAWAERLAFGLGIAASMASPLPYPAIQQTAAFLVNHTEETIEVRVRWVEARVECDAIRDRFADMLPRETFGAGTVFVLEPDEILALDRSIYFGFGGPGHLGTCDVVMIGADGLPETIVFWDGLESRDIGRFDSERRIKSGLQLTKADDGVHLVPASGYRIAAPIDVWDDGGACRDYGATKGFDWSEIPLGGDGVRVTLTDVREGIDGCMSLGIDDSEREQRAYVCVPAEDFPFVAGNVVTIWASQEQLWMRRELERDDGSRWSVAELVVHRGGGSFTEGPFDVEVVEVDTGCRGVRMDCGGFRVPGAGGIVLESGTRFVHPGGAMERDAADGRRARLRIGRAETMWVAHDACGAGRDALGARLDALVVYGEERR